MVVPYELLVRFHVAARRADMQRALAELVQAQVFEQSGARIETAEVMPTLEVIEKLARAFKIKPSELID